MLHDLYVISTSVMITTSFFCSVMLWSHSNRGRTKRVLAVAATLLTIFSLWNAYVIFSQPSVELEMFDFDYGLLCLSMVYLIYIYLSYLMYPMADHRRLMIRLSVVLAVYLLAYSYFSLTDPVPVHLYHWNDILQNLSHPVLWLRLIVGGHFILRFIYSFVRILNMHASHKKRIASRFSYHEQVSLSWVPYLLSAYTFYGAWTIFDLLISGPVTYIVVISNMFFAVFYLFFNFIGVYQQDVYSKQDISELHADERHAGKPVVISSKLRNGLKEELKKLMSERKIYLDPDLRLDGMARLLNTNRTYVSFIIKEDFGESFIGFVNHCRVKAACELMSDPTRDLVVTQIAEQVGFKSFSSFNLFFKRYTGTTPAKYRASVSRGEALAMNHADFTKPL